MMRATSIRGFTYYDEHAQEFAAAVRGRAPTDDARWLAVNARSGGLIVDAGCGTGEDARYLACEGWRVYAYDASSRMFEMTLASRDDLAQEATRRLQVACHDHLSLRLDEPASAILASASLLFLEPADLERTLQHLGSQLAPGGLLMASFKQGSAPRPQADGRVYFDQQAENGPALAWSSGLALREVRQARDGLGRDQQWVTFVMEKNPE